MNSKKNFRINFIILISALLVLLTLAGCGPSPEELAAVDYTPLPGGDWEVSSPEVEGLDPGLVAELYYDAEKLESIYSLLIVKNGKLVAEKYFNEGTVDLKINTTSVSKSYTSALVGLAYEKGCLTDLDQPFLDYFPEYTEKIHDPRKKEISIRHLLQMRSGYPWEESDPQLWGAMVDGDQLSLMVEYPLATDPGTKYHYSNATSYFLGAIVARACDVDLREFAEKNLHAPLKVELGEWWIGDGDDYPLGSCCMHFTARDAAKFGLLYLNDGVFNGDQIISAKWVHDSLQHYSTGKQIEYIPQSGRNFERIGYGYQWWGIKSGNHEYHAALGHGGQIIAFSDELDMVIVVMGYPFFLEQDSNAWKHEKQLKNLMADFIASLPSE